MKAAWLNVRDVVGNKIIAQHVTIIDGAPELTRSYVIDLRGDVLVGDDDHEDDCCVGTISAFLVHLQRSSDDGVSWADVLDSRSEDMACYLALLNSKDSGYSNWVETTLEPLGKDLPVLDRIRVKPKHRGRGYGLYAAELMMNGFGLYDGVVACQPAPYELLKRFDVLPPREAADTSRRQLISEWDTAKAKLRKHRSLLGFRRVPKSVTYLRCRWRSDGLLFKRSYRNTLPVGDGCRPRTVNAETAIRL